MTVRYHHRRGDARARLPLHRRRHPAPRPALPHRPRRRRRRRRSASCCSTPSPRSRSTSRSTVQAELEARADEADQLRRSHVERARHHAELARRRYLAVDPDNRLVADTLEADWNDALRALQTAHDDYERASTAANAALDEQHKARIRRSPPTSPPSGPTPPPRTANANASPACSSTTSRSTRPTQIHLHVRFRGGQTTSLTIPIPPNAWQARQTHPDTLALLDRLLDDHTDAEVATELNQAGHRSGTGKPFTAHIVLHLRRANDLPSHHDRLRARGLLTLAETAERLDVHPATDQGLARTPACSPPTRPTTRTSGSTSRPTPATRGSSNSTAGASPTENPPQPCPGGAL